MLPSNYHVIYMGTSYSGSVGQILTLTHVNLWFITKKPGRCGEANTERRDLVPAIYPINEPDCRKRCYRLCANDTAKSYVLCCLCVLFCPRAIPWLYLHLETITTETESLQEPSVHLSFAVSGLFWIHLSFCKLHGRDLVWALHLPQGSVSVKLGRFG